MGITFLYYQVLLSSLFWRSFQTQWWETNWWRFAVMLRNMCFRFVDGFTTRKQSKSTGTDSKARFRSVRFLIHTSFGEVFHLTLHSFVCKGLVIFLWGTKLPAIKSSKVISTTRTGRNENKRNFFKLDQDEILRVLLGKIFEESWENY